MGREDHEFGCRRLSFEVPLKSPKREIKQASVYIRLELRGVIQSKNKICESNHTHENE